MTNGRFVGVIAATFVIALCGTFSARAARAPRPTLEQRQSAGMTHNAHSRHAWLYVAGNANNVVNVYDLDRLGSPLVESITKGISSPGGIALDAQGKLYVPNQKSGNVTVYPPGDTTPTLTLTGVDAPQGIAVDSGGNVYVCNRGSNPGIAIYPAGQTQPSQHISSSLLPIPNQLVFDSTGVLYISDDDAGVSILSPGPSQTVTSLNLSGLTKGATSGIALNPSNGDLYVSNATGPPANLSVYPPAQQDPSRVKETHFGGTNFLGVGLFRGHATVFVPDSAANLIYVYQANLKGLPGVIATSSQSVNSVAFKPAGVP
jgi:hypothetical protein